MFEEKTLGTDACFLICPVPEIIIIQNHVVPMLGISFFFWGGDSLGSLQNKFSVKSWNFVPTSLTPPLPESWDS